MKYFTSDLHLGHKNMLKHRDVPVSDIEAYNKWIIERVYDIPAGSNLYILGDIAWDKASFIQLLDAKPRNIHLHIIWGNHDRNIKNFPLYNVASVDKLKTVKENNYKFVICHYPFKVWDCSHYNTINLYGHIHVGTPQIAQEGRQLNVNCDLWDYRPISSEFIINRLEGVDNWDYLEVKYEREKKDGANKVSTLIKS